MWQKLNRIDTYELEKARIQLINAIQLVNAVPRSYSDSNSHGEWLRWNNEDLSIETAQIKDIKLSLDIEQFVLTISGQNEHIEHLVLSGLTYPMAFGWMKIKMDAFMLDGDLYDDSADFTIERSLDTNEEMNVTDQHVFNNLVIYYSNAFRLFSQLQNQMNLSGKLLINPEKLCLDLIPDNSSNIKCLSFSPGDKEYPEPYFSIRTDQPIQNKANLIGILHTKGWNGLIFLASDFYTLDPDLEQNKVLNFYMNNFKQIIYNHK